MRQRGLPRLIGLHLRGDHEILPAEDHQRRQGDGEEHIVAIAVHEPISRVRMFGDGIEARRAAEPGDGMTAQDAPDRQKKPA